MSEQMYEVNFDALLLKILKENINVKQLDSTLQGLATVLKQSGLKGELYPFGSYCNGFELDSSDLDLVFITPSQEGEVKILRAIDKQLNLCNRMKQEPKLITTDRILHARVPILKIQDKTNQVDIDLSINNLNGIINSKLLLAYSQLHYKIATLGKLIKLWGKRHNMIHQRGMSSYSLILAMIHFLQVKYQIPCLQKVEYSNHQLAQLEELEYIPFFQIHSNSKVNQLDNVSLKYLLQDFFKFYQKNGEFSQNQQYISIDGYNEHSSHFTNKLPILDPINKRHDPSKRYSGFSSQYLIRFREAYEGLENNDIEGVFLISSKKPILRQRPEKRQKFQKKYQQKNDLQPILQELDTISDDGFARIFNSIFSVKTTVQSSFELLSKVINEKFPNIQVEQIGNQNQNFEITQFDIDCNLIVNDCTNQVKLQDVIGHLTQDKKIFQLIYQSQQDDKKWMVVKDVSHFCFLHIRVNNSEGIALFKLMKNYSSQYPKVSLLMKFLKSWQLKIRKLDKIFAPFSYLNIMMIQFLQENYDLDNQNDNQSSQGMDKLNYTNIWKIFQEFFQYYSGEAEGGFFSKNKCLSINGLNAENIIPDSLAILNPFEGQAQILFTIKGLKQLQLLLQDLKQIAQSIFWKKYTVAKLH